VLHENAAIVSHQRRTDEKRWPDPGTSERVRITLDSSEYVGGIETGEEAEVGQCRENRVDHSTGCEFRGWLGLGLRLRAHLVFGLRLALNLQYLKQARPVLVDLVNHRGGFRDLVVGVVRTIPLSKAAEVRSQNI
jgi:hypothetical protein